MPGNNNVPNTNFFEYDPLELLPLKELIYLQKRFKNIILSYSGGTDSTLLLLYMLYYGIRPAEVITAKNPIQNVEAKRYTKKIQSFLQAQGIFHIIIDSIDAAELLRYIKEDFKKNEGKRYDKKNYKCCKFLKKYPLRNYVKKKYKKEETVVLLGIRIYESKSRERVGWEVIKRGYFYVIPKKYYYESWPLLLLNDHLKQKLLIKLTKHFKLPMPPSSFCYICPIFYKFARANQKKTKRYKKNAEFFNRVIGQTTLPSFQVRGKEEYR